MSAYAWELAPLVAERISALLSAQPSSYKKLQKVHCAPQPLYITRAVLLRNGDLEKLEGLCALRAGNVELRGGDVKATVGA